jgi:hypothetical protein
MPGELTTVNANVGNLVMENAQIIYRNFAGREGQYNAEGDRNFCLLLDPATAQQMEADGWNVKYTKPREDGVEPRPYIQVSLKYRGRNGAPVRPPLMVMITSKGRVDLPEEMVEFLDWVDIANVDVIVRPYQWAMNGKTGIKAYVKSLFLTIQEDVLQQKYADVEYAEVGADGKPLALDMSQAARDAQDGIVEGEIVEDE